MLRKTIFSISLAMLMNGFYGCKENAETKQEKKTDVSMPVANTETVQEEKKPEETSAISFDEITYDFGKINSGDVVDHTFKFKNSGTVPLIVSNAQASCGCTVPEWTKDPILPGGEGKIKVVFNSSGKSGTQNKKVTVFANTDPNETVLSFTADILNEVKQQPSKGPLNQ